MLFALLQDRLISHIRDRVRAGEITERGLARLSGISQPHLHNVLKGIRSLSPEYADQILLHLNLSILDLLNTADLDGGRGEFRQGSVREVPRLRGIAGPQQVLERQVQPGDVYPMAQLIADPLTDPVLITLGHDPQLFPYFQAGDLALVTRTATTKLTLDSSAVYLVRTAGGTLVRSLRSAGNRLYLVTPETLEEPRRWDQLALRGQSVDEVILGKLVWIGRQLSENPFRPPQFK